MEYLVAAYRGLVFGIGASMLPSPERERFAHVHEIDAPSWSLQLGLLQGAFGVWMFLMGGLAFMRPAAADQSMILLENWWPGLNPTHFQGVGLINWFAWFLYPVSWPFAYLAMVGLVRCVAFAATREAVGEPVVWGGLRAFQAIRSRSATMRREARFGPERPDRLLSTGESTVVVVTCREKPEWVPAATIAMGDRHYHIAGVDEQQDGQWQAIAYRLREQKAGEIIRRLVHYTPPS